MADETPQDLAVPPALAAQIMAAAEAQHRPPLDVLRDALAQYLTWQPPSAAMRRRSPVEAAARIRQARKSNARLDDSALRELMTHGRA